MRAVLVFSSFAFASASFLVSNKSLASAHGGPVMIISGSSSRTELCLTAGTDGTHASLVPCATAVREGDGRELFSFQGGFLRSGGAELCLGVGTNPADGRRVALVRCDGGGRNTGATASKFELSGNGQIRIADTEACLSQEGRTTGSADVALHSAAWSTSTLAAEHSAALAVDGLPTYWASKLDPELPVDFVVQLGGIEEVEVVEIDWEYPAKSFSLLLSVDGVRWEEVYATDTNSLHTVTIPLGSKAAAEVKVSMQEPHPVHGAVQAHRLFAISRLSLHAARLRTIAEPCAEAAKSVDARDKYFLVSATLHDSAVWRDLAAEKQNIDTLSKALATTVAALHAVSHQLASCGQTHGLQSNMTHDGFRRRGRPSLRQLAVSSGIAVGQAEMLLQEARDVIIRTRTALK